MTDDIRALRARLEKLQRLWWQSAKASSKLAAKALSKKDHETAIAMTAVATTLEGAAMRLYGAVVGSEGLKRQIAAHRSRRKR